MPQDGRQRLGRAGRVVVHKHRHRHIDGLGIVLRPHHASPPIQQRLLFRHKLIRHRDGSLIVFAVRKAQINDPAFHLVGAGQMLDGRVHLIGQTGLDAFHAQVAKGMIENLRLRDARPLRGSFRLLVRGQQQGPRVQFLNQALHGRLVQLHLVRIDQIGFEQVKCFPKRWRRFGRPQTRGGDEERENCQQRGLSCKPSHHGAKVRQARVEVKLRDRLLKCSGAGQNSSPCSAGLHPAVSRICNPPAVRQSGSLQISAPCRMQFGDTADWEICATKNFVCTPEMLRPMQLYPERRHRLGTARGPRAVFGGPPKTSRPLTPESGEPSTDRSVAGATFE